MKEWVAERYALGDCLCWIAEVDEPDEENSGTVPLWLLFSCRSQMTEADRVMYNEVSTELSDAEQPVETEASRRDHDERKAHLCKVSDTPIINVAATVRYYSLKPKGLQIPSEIILERPYIDDEGNPVVRFTMTIWYDKPYPFSGYSTFSALISVLRLGWFVLERGCADHYVSLL